MKEQAAAVIQSPPFFTALGSVTNQSQFTIVQLKMNCIQIERRQDERYSLN